MATTKSMTAKNLGGCQTTATAPTSCEAGSKGSIEPGKLADLVLPAADIRPRPRRPAPRPRRRHDRGRRRGGARGVTSTVSSSIVASPTTVTEK